MRSLVFPLQLGQFSSVIILSLAHVNRPAQHANENNGHLHPKGRVHTQAFILRIMFMAKEIVQLVSFELLYEVSPM